MKREEWLGSFEAAARKGGMAKADVAEAVEYYREAIDDRMEAGMDEEGAVAALGSVDDAIRAACESLSPFRKAVAEVRKNRARSAAAVILLVLGAVIWVPVAFGLAATAVILYLVLWVLVGCMWVLDGIGFLLGMLAVPTLIHGVMSGMATVGLAWAGLFVAAGGIAIVLVPLAIAAGDRLSRVAARFGHWVARFFVRVGPESEGAREDTRADRVSWGVRHERANTTLLRVGFVVSAAGAVLFLVGWGASGFELSALTALPPMAMPFGQPVSFGG